MCLQTAASRLSVGVCIAAAALAAATSFMSHFGDSIGKFGACSTSPDHPSFAATFQWEAALQQTTSNACAVAGATAFPKRRRRSEW